MYLINIQINIIIIDAREGNMGNCHRSQTNVYLSFASVDISFLGLTISHVTHLYSQYLYNIHLSFKIGQTQKWYIHCYMMFWKETKALTVLCSDCSIQINNNMTMIYLIICEADIGKPGHYHCTVINSPQIQHL